MKAGAPDTSRDGVARECPESSADVPAAAAESCSSSQSPERGAAEVRSVPFAELAAYGALGLPLAFAALPIYVHVPRLYADGLGLSLAVVGAVLLAARIVDAVTDPPNKSPPTEAVTV